MKDPVVLLSKIHEKESHRIGKLSNLAKFIMQVESRPQAAKEELALKAIDQENLLALQILVANGVSKEFVKEKARERFPDERLVADQYFDSHEFDKIKEAIEQKTIYSELNKKIDGEYLIIHAAKEKNYELLTKLLEAGANPNVIDKEGKTALDYVEDLDMVRKISHFGGQIRENLPDYKEHQQSIDPRWQDFVAKLKEEQVASYQKPQAIGVYNKNPSVSHDKPPVEQHAIDTEHSRSRAPSAARESDSPVTTHFEPIGSVSATVSHSPVIVHEHKSAAIEALDDLGLEVSSSSAFTKKPGNRRKGFKSLHAEPGDNSLSTSITEVLPAPVTYNPDALTRASKLGQGGDIGGLSDAIAASAEKRKGGLTIEQQLAQRKAAKPEKAMSEAEKAVAAMRAKREAREAAQGITNAGASVGISSSDHSSRRSGPPQQR